MCESRCRSFGIPLWTPTPHSGNVTAVKWRNELLPESSFAKSALHGVLNGNTDCAACFQGVSNLSAATAPFWNTTQDECCIARQLSVAQLDTGAFSLQYQSRMTASEAATMLNPTCDDLMMPPAARSDLDPDRDVNGNSDSVNVERAVVRATGSHCLSKCPPCL